MCSIHSFNKLNQYMGTSRIWWCRPLICILRAMSLTTSGYGHLPIQEGYDYQHPRTKTMGHISYSNALIFIHPASDWWYGVPKHACLSYTEVAEFEWISECFCLIEIQKIQCELGTKQLAALNVTYPISSYITVTYKVMRECHGVDLCLDDFIDQKLEARKIIDLARTHPGRG